MQQRTLFDGKNCGREILVVQKMFQMQCVQQNSKVSLNNFSNFESEFNAKMNTPKANFLQCQIWIVNYNVKNESKNLSNENINTSSRQNVN